MGGKVKRKQYVSKGQRPNTSESILKAVTTARTEVDKQLHLVNAWLSGKNPWLTVKNPNIQERAKRLIRVRANAEWGNPKNINKGQ